MGVVKENASFPRTHSTAPSSRKGPSREVKPFDAKTLSYDERYQVGGLFASLVDVTGADGQRAQIQRTSDLARSVNLREKGGLKTLSALSCLSPSAAPILASSLRFTGFRRAEFAGPAQFGVTRGSTSPGHPPPQPRQAAAPARFGATRGSISPRRTRS